MAILAQCDYCLKRDVEVTWPGIMIKQLDRSGVAKDFYFCSKHCVIEFEEKELEFEFEKS